MRLIKYINEEKQLKFNFFRQFEKEDKITRTIKQFEKDVKPWFSYCKKQRVKNKFLWRGGDVVVKDFIKLKTRTDREPTDMCIEMHNFFDEKFYNKFKIHARSQTVFCFPSLKAAKHYGSKQNIIIPIGKFDYIWSPKIDDLFSHIENETYYDDMCKNSYDYNSDYDDEYESEYGESMNGVWMYNGDSTDESDLSDAVNTVIQDMIDSGEIDEDDDDDEIIYQIEDNLVWQPEVSLDEFIENKIFESEQEAEDIIDNNYIMNKKFKDLMDNITYRSNEIMLNCKSYYIINEDFARRYYGD